MKFEPVLNKEIVMTIISALLTVLVTFNVPLSDDQRNALVALAAGICALFFGGGVVVRSLVTPVDKPNDE